MTKGRKAPAAPTDHAADLRERLGRVAYEAGTGSEGDDTWETCNATSKEHYRRIADAVKNAIITGGKRSGSFGVASTYGAATRQPYVELTIDVSPSQVSPAKAREMALMLLECADAAESDATMIEFGRAALNLDELHAAQLLAQFRRFREDQRGKGVDAA